MSFPPRALDFTNDVAIVTGAGSRMDGEFCIYQPLIEEEESILFTGTHTYTNHPTGEIGNGRASAILLARHGAKVALLDLNIDWAKDTKRMIDEEGGVSEIIQCDVTNEESCKKAVAKTLELWGAVHILVNIGELFLFAANCGGGQDLLNASLTQI